MHDTTQPPVRSRQIRALYAIFFVSGFCGLIYESIWSHYLKLLLGHAAYAQAVVLVVFIGGLAVGAWVTGRWSERLRRPILIYAAVEALVGVFALGFQRLFEAASAWASTSFLPAVCGEPGSCAASWVLASALILPPSILLGTTFPLMSAGVIRLGARPGRGLSLLYFLNSAGAALGVLGSGFLLIPALGLPGTVLLAGSLNLLVALTAFASGSVGDENTAAPATPQRPSAQSSTLELRILLLVAALTGLSSFVYEVVWIRMLSLVFGAATHSFELMLSAFILGLALGAWWIRNRIDTAASVVRRLAAIQVLMGVLAVATLPLYASLFDTMAFILRILQRTEEAYGLYNVAMGVMAAAVMLPATICAGMTLPLVTAALLRGGHGERQVGQVYGVNTFGGIAGVLLTMHLLLPALGLKWSLAFGALIDIALGLLLWRLAARREPAPPRRLPVPALAAGAACAALVSFPMATSLDSRMLASGVFRTGLSSVEEGRSTLFHRDGKTATVTVLELPGGARSLLTNGKSDGATHPQAKTTTPDDATMVLLGALGPIHHPQARRAAVIGLGTGTSSAVLLESPRLEALDTIEIEPMMVEAAQLFRPRNAKVFDDPRSRIVIDDARAHFAKARIHYDLIVSEPSNPWVSGVSGLFTTEFYQHVANHLAADGHFVQWLHTYEANPQVVGSIVRAFSSVFPEFNAYTTNNADVVLVARRDGRIPVIDVAALDSMEGIRRWLMGIGINSAAGLAAHGAGPASAIRVLAQSYGAPPNSDYFPFVDNNAARTRFLHQSAAPLFALSEAPLPFLEFGTGPSPHAGQFTMATSFMPRALHQAAAGRLAMRYLQDKPVAPEEAAWYSPYAVDLALIRAWSKSCAVPAETAEAWQAVVRVASILNAGAMPNDAQRFWNTMTQHCGAKLTLTQSAWLRLLAAVSGRDADATQQLGAQVLAQDKQLTPSTRAFATLATVSAQLAKGERTRASEVLAEQRAHLPESEMEKPWFRLLVMILSARQASAQP